MKPEKNKTEKDPEKDLAEGGSGGIDFLIVLQAGAGLFCLAILVWGILHYVLNVL